MADEQQPPSNGQSNGQEQEEQQPGPVPYERFKALTEQHKTLKAQWDRAEAAAQKAKELELKEQQKWQKLYEERESELSKERQERLKLRVALVKGVSSEAIDDFINRLRGDTEEDLIKDADKLLAFYKPAESAGRQAPGVPPSRGSRPARLEIEGMTPAQIREHKEALYKQAQS